MGLIKTGRAQWTDERKSKICLLLSPALYSEEDKVMNIYDNDGNVISDDNMHSESGTAVGLGTFQMPKGMPGAESSAVPELSLGYILGQIEKIRADSAHIHESLKAVIEIPADSSGSRSGAEKAEAIGRIVSSREATHQRLLETYEKMYSDLRPVRDDRIVSNQASIQANNETKIKMLEVAREMVQENDEFAEHFAQYFGEAMKDAFRN